MSIRNRTYLSRFIPVARGLQQHLGSLYEIILHDVSEPDASIIFIAGNLTNRLPGGPLTNVVMEEMKRRENDAEDMIGYKTELKDGRIFKSSTIFIRDEQGILMGCFCINMDVTAIHSTVDFLKDATSFSAPRSTEFFGQSIEDVVENIVAQQLAASDVPVQSMSRNERLNFVLALNAKGIFEVKGSVERVAQLLGVSVFTVYSYLKDADGGKQAGTG